MKKSHGFNLFGVILIIIITAVVTSIATGVIMLNNSSTGLNGNLYKIENDQELKDFIEVYETLLSKYYDNIDKKGMLSAAEEAMIKFLGDKYTTYLDDKEYQEILSELSGEYNRVGISIEGNTIINVTPLGAAARVGIKKGDLLISIDNINVEKMDASQISEIIKNGGQELAIQVYRDNNYLDFNLKKDIYPSISYQLLDDTSIGYIYIKSFSQNLSDQIAGALKDLESKGIKALVVDVRDNAGGYLAAAEETASLFLEKGKIIYSLESNNKKYTYNDENIESRTYPIAVLINRGSASAAEILAAALRYSYNGILIGDKSYGKGKVQQVLSLNSGDSVKYTSAKWLTPLGECIDGIGLFPDYNVNYQEEDIYDSQIMKAIELLQ